MIRGRRLKFLASAITVSYSCVRMTYITWSKLRIATMIIFIIYNEKPRIFTKFRKRTSETHRHLRKHKFVLKFAFLGHFWSESETETRVFGFGVQFYIRNGFWTIYSLKKTIFIGKRQKFKLTRKSDKKWKPAIKYEKKFCIHTAVIVYFRGPEPIQQMSAKSEKIAWVAHKIIRGLTHKYHAHWLSQLKHIFLNCM